MISAVQTQPGPSCPRAFVPPPRHSISWPALPERTATCGPSTVAAPAAPLDTMAPSSLSSSPDSPRGSVVGRHAVRYPSFPPGAAGGKGTHRLGLDHKARVAQEAADTPAELWDPSQTCRASERGALGPPSVLWCLRMAIISRASHWESQGCRKNLGAGRWYHQVAYFG